MFKRGQISLFMVVCIVLLVVILASLAVETDIMEEKAEAGAIEFQESAMLGENVKNYVQSCLDASGDSAVVALGRYGGYFSLPAASHEKLSLPYYIHNKENSMLSKEELQNQLGLMAVDRVQKCADFTPFTERGYTIQQSEPTVAVKLGNDQVALTLDFPLVVEKEGVQKEVNGFSSMVPTRLGLIHDVVSGFVAEEVQSPSGVCLSCLVNLGLANNLKVQMNSLQDGSVVFLVRDHTQKHDGKPYTYAFMNQYSFEEEAS